MSLTRTLFLWFASGLCVAFGSKLGEFIAKEVTTTKGPAQEPPGSAARELCPQCGRSLRRIARQLFCANCGYREG